MLTIKLLQKYRKLLSWVWITCKHSYDIIMIAYLVYLLVFGIDNFIVNAILLALLIPSIIISISLKEKMVKKTIKKKKIVKIRTLRKAKHVFKVARLLVKTYTLSLTIYGVIVAITMASPIAIASMIASIIMWLFALIAEICTLVIDSFAISFEKDKEALAVKFSEGKDYAVEKLGQGKEYVIGKYAEGKEYAKEKYAEGKEYTQEKLTQGKEYVQEKYEQGKEYAQGVVEQGKTKLDETKTTVQDFFKKSKKAE